MKKYLLFDESAIVGGPDKSSVLAKADSIEQCKKINLRYVQAGQPCGVWYSYDEQLNPATGETELVNERQMMSLYGVTK